ncbi:MAG TPA: MarR family transcriptional regulator [Solirubrobacteraceae bacterium]|nr:MarR family transcriptional regulator [Solirubrobacteraceae bacterium]
MIDQARQRSLRQAIEDLYFGYRAFTALPDAILAQRGLGRTHHRILYFVCRDPGISVGQLLAVLRISKQAAHRPISELGRHDLIAVSADTSDRRIRRLSPTDSGIELEAQLSESQMQLLAATFADCGPETERHWRQVMTRLAHEGGD